MTISAHTNTALHGHQSAWNRLEKITQVNTHPLLSFCLYSLSLTHSLLWPCRFRWFWGDFMVAVLLMVPVKHETFLFPPNRTHMHCLWAVIQDIHRQPETRGWRQLYRARKSCQVLHTHIHTLILDLYGVLHPPLSTAVKVFLNSYKSAIFKEHHACTHTPKKSHTDF